MYTRTRSPSPSSPAASPSPTRVDRLPNELPKLRRYLDRLARDRTLQDVRRGEAIPVAEGADHASLVTRRVISVERGLDGLANDLAMRVR
jgi:hypothetical protein